MPVAWVASSDCLAEALPRQPSKSASVSAGGDSEGRSPSRRSRQREARATEKCGSRNVSSFENQKPTGTTKGSKGTKEKSWAGEMGARGKSGARVSHLVRMPSSIPDFFVPSVTFVVEFVCCGPRPSRVTLAPIDGRVGIVEGLQVAHPDELDLSAPLVLRLLAEKIPGGGLDEEEASGSPLLPHEFWPISQRRHRRRGADGLRVDVPDDSQRMSAFGFSRPFGRLARERTRNFGTRRRRGCRFESRRPCRGIEGPSGSRG